MADQALDQKTAATTLAAADIFYVMQNPSTTKNDRKITFQQLEGLLTVANMIGGSAYSSVSIPQFSGLGIGVAGSAQLIQGLTLQINGSTAGSGNLTVSSTSATPKGKILFGTVGAFDEANTRLGLGTQSPTTDIQIVNTTSGTANLTVYVQQLSTAYHSQVDLKSTREWLVQSQGTGGTYSGGFVVRDNTASLDRFAIDSNGIIYATANVRTSQPSSGSANLSVVVENLATAYHSGIDLKAKREWYVQSQGSGGTYSGGFVVTDVTAGIDRMSISSAGTFTLGANYFVVSSSGTLALGANSLFDNATDRLGLGTTSPSYHVHAYRASGGTSNLSIAAENLATTYHSQVILKSARQFTIGSRGTTGTNSSSFVISDDTAALDRFAIDSAGKVYFGSTATTVYDAANNRIGIGTASPSVQLHISQASSGAANITARVESLALGFNSQINLKSTRDWIIQSQGTSGTPSGSLQFYDNTAGASRACIDSAGAFLLGTTASPTSLGAGILVFADIGSTAASPTLSAATACIFQSFSSGTHKLYVKNSAGTVTLMG